MEPIILDNTKRGVFRTCKRKYFLQVINGLQPLWGSTALRYGATWHGIMEGFYSTIQEKGWPKDATTHMEAITNGLQKGKAVWDSETNGTMYVDDYRNFNTAVEAFDKYLEFFFDDGNFLKVIHTEQKFQCPIEPDNDLEEKLLRKMPPIIFTGKIDLGVIMDHMPWILDFKTTGWRLDKVIMEANRSPQLVGYSYAGAKVLDFKPSGCLLSFSYVISRKSPKTGEYGSTNYEFRRVPQIYTPGDISAWKLSFIDTCREILYHTEQNYWPESFDNCFDYGRCPYLPLCQQHVPFEDLNLEGYRVKFWDVLDEE